MPDLITLGLLDGSRSVYSPVIGQSGDGVGATHHIKLGTHYYMLRPGSYSRRPAPTFGARFTTGDPDWNNLSMWQHWAQRCFIGGAGQDLWADDAMYDEAIGLDTTDHEVVRLSRDLQRGAGSNWRVSSDATGVAASGFKAFVFNSKLYVLTIPAAGYESKLWEYSQATDGWTSKTAIAGKDICGRSVALFDGKVFIGGYSTATGKAKVIYDDGNLGSWTTLALPSSTEDDAKWAVHAMQGFQQRLYIAYGTRVWRFKEDGGSYVKDGNTVFYKANANSSSNRIVSMEVHLGFLYMLSSNGHVHRSDGNATFDIWNWDGQTEGVAIRSFDGRLFILTFEYTETTDVGYGCLYQMSGSAVTLLKRWGDETEKTRIGNMRVYDRKLWYGASNGLGFAGVNRVFGVAVYDPVEDAHSIAVSNGDSSTYTKGTAGLNWIVDDQIHFGGQIFAFVRGWGAFRTPYKPKDVLNGIRRYDITRAGTSVADTNGGWVTTSTYDAGTAGVKKMWRKIIVDAATPTGTSLVVAYSLDNGTSWTTAGTVTVPSARKEWTFFLNNKISTSLKLRITLRSTDATKTPTLWGFVVSYMPMPEPNWMWTFSIVLANKVTLLDGTVRTQDTEAELDYLTGLQRSGALVDFIDVDGVVWATNGPGVMIYDMTQNLRDLLQPLESDVSMTLLEAVEIY